MKKINLLAVIILLIPFPSLAREASSKSYGRFAQLQILNKTTAKSSIIEVKIGEEVIFGGISIKVRKCWQAPLDQRPESKILIDVAEVGDGDGDIEIEDPQENRIFYGWIFASSPSLSGLEHPIYDITAISCGKKK